MRTRLLPLTLLLVTFALLASACGGPLSKSEYESKASAIGKDVDKSLADLAQDPPTSDEIQETADTLSKATDELDALDPPEEVRAAHDLMISGLRGMVTTFEAMGDKLEAATTDDAKMQAFLTTFNTPKAKKAVDDLTKAQVAFNKAGYTVFGDGEAAPKPKPAAK